MNNNAWIFLKETFQRFSSPSSKYFKVWNVVNIILVVVGVIPDILDWLGIILPSNQYTVALQKIFVFCGSYGYVMSKLNVQRKVVTQSGVILTPEDSKGEEKKPVILPYTDKVENKKVMAKIENAETIQVAQEIPAVEVKKPDNFDTFEK